MEGIQGGQQLVGKENRCPKREGGAHLLFPLEPRQTRPETNEIYCICPDCGEEMWQEYPPGAFNMMKGKVKIIA